jgi:hypothetical protein
MPNGEVPIIDITEQNFSAVNRLKTSNDMLNQVFSCLAGCEIIHKIAVISKRFR